MLIATIILNKYQQHLFNISTLVFNNILQCTLKSFACGSGSSWGFKFHSRHKFVFHYQFRLFVFYPDLGDCMFSLSPGTFLPPSKPFKANKKIFAIEKLLSPFLRRGIERQRFLSFQSVSTHSLKTCLDFFFFFSSFEFKLKKIFFFLI